MRVLMVAPTPFFASRGAHMRIYEEALSLQETGHRLLITTYRSGSDPKDIAVARNPGGRRQMLPGPNPQRVPSDVRLFFTTRAAIARFCPDVVHAHLLEGLAVSLPRKAWYGRVPVAMDLQGSFVEEVLAHGWLGRDRAATDLFLKAEAWLTRLADAVFTSSHQMRDFVIDRFSVPRRNVEVLEDAVNTRTFYPQREQPEVRQGFGIPPGRDIVVYLGSLETKQGVEELFDVARAVVPKMPNVHFLVAGTAISRPLEGYRAEAKRLGLQDHMSFPGTIDYFLAPQVLALGKVAVSLKVSTTESNGKLLPYMAMGLPTVAYDSGMTARFLGPAGRLVRPGDIGGFADHVIGLLQMPAEERAQIGKALRERAVQEFSWKRRAEQMSAVYAKLAPQSANGTA